MHHRIESRVAVHVATFVVLLAVGCSSAPDPGLPSPSSSQTTTPTKPSPTPGGTATSSDPTSPPPSGTTTPAGDCGKSADADTCADCCLAKSPTAYDAVDAVFNECICGATGGCKTECADTVCAAQPKAPSAACDACLGGTAGKACDDKANTACQADAACKSVDACVASQCAALAGKP